MQRSIIGGAVLAVIGGALLLLGEFGYTREETALDLGALQVQTETRETVPVPPVLSAIVLAAGVGLIAYGVARR